MTSRSLFQLDAIRHEALTTDGVLRCLCLDARGRVVPPTDPSRVALRVLQLSGELTFGREAIQLMFRVVVARDAYARDVISLMEYLSLSEAALIELSRFVR